MHADEEGIEKPTCTICGEDFNIKYKLKKHMALKHGGETFDCFICKARFYLKGHLNTHQRHVHEGKIVPSMEKHSCTVCGIKYPLWKIQRKSETMWSMSCIFQYTCSSNTKNNFRKYSAI